MLLMMFNSDMQDTDFALPPPAPGSSWQLAFDTARAPPQDVCVETDAIVNLSTPYQLGMRASAILVVRAPRQ